MLSFAGIERVYLACGSTDLRRSIDGLAVIVSQVFRLDPFAPCLFVFCNRRRDKLKILYWDVASFWLLYRCLEKGRFQWPATSDTTHLNKDDLPCITNNRSMKITAAERSDLIEDKVKNNFPYET